jgi:hypothetical protein
LDEVTLCLLNVVIYDTYPGNNHCVRRSDIGTIKDGHLRKVVRLSNNAFVLSDSFSGDANATGVVWTTFRERPIHEIFVTRPAVQPASNGRFCG